MSNNLEIIYLVQNNFNQWDFTRHGVENFVRAGFKTHVLDLTPVISPAIYNETKLDFQSSNFRYMPIRCISDFKLILDKISQDQFIIAQIVLTKETLPIFTEISKREIPYLINLGNTIPSIGKISDLIMDRLPWDYIFNFFSFLGIEFNQNKYTVKKLGLSGARYKVLSGTKSSLMHYHLVDYRTKPIWAHCYDYDIYLDLKNDNEEIIKGDYSVFLDSFAPFHPDFAVTKQPNDYDNKNYYPSLCTFLDDYEKKVGHPVVICAHPRSDYENRNDDFFQGRKIVKGYTAKLVKNSKSVLLHDSTSISFAIFYKKPVHFLSFSFLTEGILKRGVYRMARLLGRVPVIVDNTKTYPQNYSFEINENKYINYQQRYLKNNNIELKLWDIVINKIKNDYQIP